MVVILAAFLVSASFYPLNIWWTAILGYLLFFIGIKRTSQPIIFAFAFGLLSNLVILHWTGKYVGSLPWVLLSLLQASFYLPIGALYKWKASIAYLLPAFIVIDEIRTRFPFGGFGWTRIGFSQSESPYLPLASLGGVPLLSWMVLLISYLLLHINFRLLVVIVGIVLLPLLLVNPSERTRSLDVVGVQGNTPSLGLSFNERARGVFNLHLDETRKMVFDSPDLIVWPENAIDIDPIENLDVARDISKLTRELNSPLLAGAVVDKDGELINASILFDKDGQVVSLYQKRYLTPFGEYMPLRNIAEKISPYASDVIDFKSGDQQTIHQVKQIKIGPIICYELLNDGLLRETAKASEILVVQTNSATFANTPEPRQQFAMTKIRAVEHNRNIVAVSTVGISGFIDNNGNMLKKSKENRAEVISGQIYANSSRTIVDIFGGWALILVILLSLFSSFIARRFE